MSCFWPLDGPEKKYMEPLSYGASCFRISSCSARFAATKALNCSSTVSSRYPNFKTIDDFSNGVATSIKTIDLKADSYKSISQLKATLRSYTRAISNFNGAKMGAIDIRENQINARVLRVGVEPGAATAEQQAALEIGRA